MNKEKTIKIDYITKIEGHAKLFIKSKPNNEFDVKLEVFEGARFFEGLLLGKKYDEIPVITSRICGVCPQAHSLASILAIEKAFDIKVNDNIKNIRKILLIGQIIKSHILHLYFLGLPDYFGKTSILEMVRSHKEIIESGMKLKAIGNQITTILGGREIHSITAIPGGFTKLPSEIELKKLKNEIKTTIPLALKGIKMFANFDVPNFKTETNHLYLKTKKGPNLIGDTICSDKICEKVDNYLKIMDEYIETYSTAKRVQIKDESFMVGAMSRVNQTKLSDEVKKELKNIEFPFKNPYYNNLAQIIEVYEFLKETINLIDHIKICDKCNIEVKPKKGTAISAIEAPRGILFHEYEFDNQGFVTKANIITPTTQNLKNLEEDIKKLLKTIDMKNEKNLTFEVEKLIRAYDPCISCSTHFLEIIKE